ncbi:MAG TPA: hemerythrin domain-containing protein [Bacillota bacterium]|nr:hemerythrin domain-containing protein [Bacillota bacterium]
MKNHKEFTSRLPALRIIENEHHLLRYLMEQWHPNALLFERDDLSVEEARSALTQLKEQIISFKEPLRAHLDKEEYFLFPQLEKYVGDEQGPVVATEEEHEEIFAFIDHFLHHAADDLEQLTVHEMKDISQDAAELFEILTFHFVKEESVIFPMVQDILTNSEQYDLFENMYSSII